MTLSREELERFTLQSADPKPLGRVARPHHNAGLTDKELIQKIDQRNDQGEPTFLLRQEYQRRLDQRGL